MCVLHVCVLYESKSHTLTHTSTQTHTHIYTHIYTQIHTHAHTHAHIQLHFALESLICRSGEQLHYVHLDTGSTDHAPINTVLEAAGVKTVVF